MKDTDTNYRCSKTFKLNTGAEMPAIGLGTWKCTDEECYDAVMSALKSGYTHIDTARVYGNEVAVGKAINDFLQETKTPRENLFITTKIWCTEVKEPEKALRSSLERLNLDYVDLYLQHWPIAIPSGDELMPTDANGFRTVLPYEEWNYIDTYRGMQPLVSLGLTKAIGISNFNIPKIEKLLSDPEVTIVPACNQVEMHPCLPQPELLEYCKLKNILVQCYSPLGSTGAPVLEDKTLKDISIKKNVSPACVTLSWGVGRGTVVLPKSVNPERIASNFKTITLTPEEIELIEEIGIKSPRRINNPKWGTKLNIFAESDRF